MRKSCTIDACERSAHGHGMCHKHYVRWYNHGDPRHERPSITDCRVDGCERRPRSRSTDLCETHYYRIRRNGNLELRDTRRDDATYRAAHARTTRDRGPARTHRCIDCGGQAHHWSYRHDDPNEMTSPGGQPYSLDPGHYDPRCAPCHARFDGTGANQYTRA